MVMCLGQGADFHMAHLMPLPLTISCSSKSRLVVPYYFAHDCCTVSLSYTQLFYSPLGFCPGLPRWDGTRKVKSAR